MSLSIYRPMDGFSSGTSSDRFSSPESEGIMNMFFDFGTSAQGTTGSFESSAAGQSQSQELVHRGGVRVSLACVPCRSRHVKCEGTLPSCSRCLQDDKPCFYAKSRRGMRDKNTPRKRASMRDTGKESPSNSSFNNSGNYAMNYSNASTSEPYTRASSDASMSPVSSTSRLSERDVSTGRLLDLYYNFFHKAHPYLLPQYHFRSRLRSDPESLKYLLPIMKYIGSLYAPDISSTELHADAMSLLDNSNLPPNGFTVQMLLMTAIAIHCNGEVHQDREILDRAIYLGLDIRMNTRAFATMERDPVLAESWRRTYWGLYITDGYFGAKRRAPTFTLHAIEADVELPCEESDYDGIIPRSKTFDQYETRDFEDETPVFSSLTYLIDLIRISGSLLSLDTMPSEFLESATSNADAMLINWKLHLPREKQSVIDRNEEVDEVLFQAQFFYQLLQIHIHRPLSRLFHSPIEKISHCAPPPPDRETAANEDKSYWLHTKKTLEAADAALNLFALPSPFINHTPLSVCGIVLATLANLSACAYILTGSEWNRTRDRIRLGLGVFKPFSEIWEQSRLMEKETKVIARSVFALPRPGVEKSAFAPVGGLKIWDQTQVLTAQQMDQNVGWADLGNFDYSALFNGMEQVQSQPAGWYGVQNVSSGHRSV